MLKTWNLFIDDIREISFANRNDLDFELARSFDDAVRLCTERKSLPTFISFDHDLGWNEQTNSEAKSGYDFAKFFVECVLDGIYEFPENFEWQVHSSNPPGRINIEELLKNFTAHYHKCHC